MGYSPTWRVKSPSPSVKSEPRWGHNFRMKLHGPVKSQRQEQIPLGHPLQETTPQSADPRNKCFVTTLRRDTRSGPRPQNKLMTRIEHKHKKQQQNSHNMPLPRSAGRRNLKQILYTRKADLTQAPSKGQHEGPATLTEYFSTTGCGSQSMSCQGCMSRCAFFCHINCDS